MRRPWGLPEPATIYLTAGCAAAPRPMLCLFPFIALLLSMSGMAGHRMLPGCNKYSANTLKHLPLDTPAYSGSPGAGTQVLPFFTDKSSTEFSKDSV